MKKLNLLPVILLMVMITNFSLYAYGDKIAICDTQDDVYLPASEISKKYRAKDGTLICWLDGRHSGSLYLQKLDLQGHAQWTANGVMLDSNLGYGFNEDSDYPALFSDNNGGAIVIYRKKFIGYEEIYAGKISENGNPAVKVVCLSDHYTGYNYSPAATKSNAEEFVVTWENFSNGNFDIHAQKIDFNLNKLWESGREIVICDHPADQRKPTITTGTEGNIYISWLDTRNHSEYYFDLYACRLIKTDKQVIRRESIKLLFSSHGDYGPGNSSNFRKENMFNHNLIPSDNNTFIIAFDHYVENESSKIILMKVNENLDAEWSSGIESESDQSLPLIVTDNKHGAQLIWNDTHNNQNLILGGAFNKDGGKFITNKNGTLVSCDNQKYIHRRILPSSRNSNGMFYENGFLYISWVTRDVNKLFIKSLNLADGSGQCSNIIEIDNQIIEGELTSITTQMNKLIVVYKQNDNLFAAVRKLPNDDFGTARPKISLDNFPNPFNPSTQITYNIPSDGFVRLSIYDVTGRMIYDKPAEFQKAGSHDLIFNASHLPTGIYFYRLETNGYTMTKKMMMIK